MTHSNQRLSILAVEDSDSDFKNLKVKLNSTLVKHSLHRCYSGDTVIPFLSRNTICLIILDLGLPILDGFELLPMIKAHPQCKKIPVLIYSGMTEHPRVKFTLKNGAEAIINKDIEQDTALDIFLLNNFKEYILK